MLLACARVFSVRRLIHSPFNEWKNDSMGALSQQLAFRLMLWTIPRPPSSVLYESLAYVMPLSECSNSPDLGRLAVTALIRASLTRLWSIRSDIDHPT